MLATLHTPLPAPGTAGAAAADDDATGIVARMARGDSAALVELYDRLAPRVLALLDRILRSRTEAEDLLQEVFVEVWRRAPDYDVERSSVTTWVTVLARSRAIDALRARQRRGALHERAPASAYVGEPAPAPDVAAVAIARERAVHRALTELTDVQRVALELAYFEGLSHREIAERIGVPLGTVKSRIIGAMKVLRAALHATRTGTA